MKRLSAATVAAARGVEPPPYDRAGVTPAPFVHLGLGGFARAHLAVYADDLLRAGYPATAWAVSLRHHRMEEQLGPQDGLYTVTTREPAAAPALRLIGSVVDTATGRDAAVDALAAPTTTFVTMTVTEKAYRARPSEPSEPSEPSMPAVVAAGLHERRLTGGSDLVVASLDNLLDNGVVLHDRVIDAADRLDPRLPAWIDAHVQFPRSVVDRMVPATTDGDRADVAERLGLRDEAAVVAEAHRSWVIEAVDGLPPLADAGVDVVADVGPHQQRKLWLLNGPHSALAYGGLLAGRQTIADATADPMLAAFVDGLVDDVLAVIEPHGPTAAEFAATSLRRFANPFLGHTCVQVGADGSQKLAQRVFPVVEARRRQGRPNHRFALVVATWLAAVTGTAVAGRRLPAVEDPMVDALSEAHAAGGPFEAVALALGPAHAWWVPEVAAAADRVRCEGLGALQDRP